MPKRFRNTKVGAQNKTDESNLHGASTFKNESKLAVMTKLRV